MFGESCVGNRLNWIAEVKDTRTHAESINLESSGFSGSIPPTKENSGAGLSYPHPQIYVAHVVDVLLPPLDVFFGYMRWPFLYPHSQVVGVCYGHLFRIPRSLLGQSLQLLPYMPQLILILTPSSLPQLFPQTWSPSQFPFSFSLPPCSLSPIPRKLYLFSLRISLGFGSSGSVDCTWLSCSLWIEIISMRSAWIQNS